MGYKITECSFLTDLDKTLVKECDRAGYKAITVCCYDPEVTISDRWHNHHKGSFIAGEPDEKSKKKGREDGWPAIWRIVEKLGGSAGCGNSHQKQLRSEHPYTKCSYRKIDGEWWCFNYKDAIAEMTKPYGI
jgi:hypothetical protein